MENVLENGTEILLFRTVNGKEVPNIYTFMRGIIISSESKEYNALHGSPLVEQIYKIQCEDGHVYTAQYRNTVNGYCIRTLEDYSRYIKESIKEHTEKLSILEKDIDKLNNIYYNLEQLIENDKTIRR